MTSKLPRHTSLGSFASSLAELLSHTKYTISFSGIHSNEAFKEALIPIVVRRNRKRRASIGPMAALPLKVDHIRFPKQQIHPDVLSSPQSKFAALQSQI
jgi:hypothetical protein